MSNKEKKRRERKAKTLAEKKTKAERRQNLIDTCKSNFVTDESLVKLLKSSRNIGQNKQTKKERLQEAFYREKLGLKVSDERELVQEVEVDDTAIPVVAPISGITYRKPEPIKPAKIADMEELFEAPVLRVSVPAPKASGPYIPVKSDTLDHEMFKGNADPTKAEELKIKEHVKSYRPAEVEESRKSLPIINYERELLESVDSNLFTIVVGETGSGKSTQVPQILYEAGYAKNGLIGVTQPRRVAAISLSQRVGHELGLKNRVSHQVRYDASVTAETSIKFMTDGILLREICGDLLVSQYSVIVIDEAHERGVNTDILLGLLSRIAFLREKTDIQLKVIIMSATLRLDDFLSNPMLFQDIKPTVISVEARQHPVDIHYQKSTEETGVMDNCFRKVCKINNKLPEGGVLVFLPGKKDVLEMVSRLRAEIPAAKVLPLYSMLSPKKQMRVFETQEEGERVIIVSTNVAETSLTIPGIRYVVDSGLEKVKVFNNKLQLSQY